MALFDFLTGGGGENPQNPQEAQVLADVQNSVAPQAPTSPSQPVQGQEQGGSLGFLQDAAGGFQKLFTDPGFIMQMNAFSSAMGNDGQGYENWTNAYTQRLQEREAEQRRIAAEQRKQDEYQRNQETQALYDFYTPESVAEYRRTGDYSVLRENPQYGLARQRLEQGYDRLGIQGSAENRRQSGQEFAFGEGGITLGDGQTRVRDPGVYQGSDGVFYRVDRGPSGLSVAPVERGEQTDLQSSQSGATDPTVAQQNQDIATLRGAIEAGDTDPFVGQVISRVPGAGDVVSSFSDPATRTAYQAADRINAYMENQGIGAAREMGASGINTVSEAEMFFRSMPRLDMTSTENLKRSLDDIEQYVQGYNQRQSASGATRLSGGSQEPTGSQAQPSSRTAPTASSGRPVGAQIRVDGQVYRKVKEGPDSDQSNWEAVQ